MKNTVFDCMVMDLPKIHNRAGNITSIENQFHVPFDIKRVYYLYDVPGGSARGGHAHNDLEQFIVAVSGAFDVLLDDGINIKTIHLDRPYNGVYIVSGIWRELMNFSSGATCLVLASQNYSEDDYIRDRDEYLKLRS